MKTVRIKLKSRVYGAWQGKPGDEVERPELEAQRLIKGGYAESMEAPAPKEKTTHEEKQ